MHTVLLPEGWTVPKGYANGIAARGLQIYVGGQIGWNSAQQFESDDFVHQTAGLTQCAGSTSDCACLARTHGAYDLVHH